MSDDLAGWTWLRQSGGLPRPGLDAVNVIRLDSRVSQTLSEPSLDGIRRGRRGVGGRCSTDVGRGDAASGATGEGPCDRRILWAGSADRVGPSCRELRLRAPKEPGADLHRRRAEDDRGGDATRIGDAPGCD